MQNHELIKEISALFEHWFQEVDQRFEAVESCLRELNERISNLERYNVFLNNRMTSLEVAIENETNKGIQLVVEGYFDLNRKLDCILKNEGERELMNLRLSHRDNEIRRIKEQITA